MISFCFLTCSYKKDLDFKNLTNLAACKTSIITKLSWGLFELKECKKKLKDHYFKYTNSLNTSQETIPSRLN